MNNEDNRKSILVIGGGISGITTALEAAEVGHHVILIEKRPYLGGRVMQTYQYFPKLCPPQCGMEINLRRIRQNPRIRYFTMAEVESIKEKDGVYDVAITISPRYVNAKCTACGKCAEACTVEIPNEFNYGINKSKAVYLPHEMAFPMRYVLDKKVCSPDELTKIKDACPYDAIDLDMEPETVHVTAGAIVIATGWEPYDAKNLENLGFGKCQNVITNVMMERLAAPNGPTDGKITRPSDGKEVTNIAFVQCAGSRDENHLRYCSTVCCMASMKHARYIREKHPEAKITIFYIDVRAPGRLESFYQSFEDEENVTFIKGKVGKIEEAPGSGDLTVEVEDVMQSEKINTRFDLVVLATGMVPVSNQSSALSQFQIDEYGFGSSGNGNKKVQFIGCAARPEDVASCTKRATGAALRAIQAIK